MITATSSYLRFVHGWDAQSALFGASPGALAQVMTLASEYKADLRAIAIVQTMRVVALTLGIPAGLSFFGLTVEGGGLMARFIAAGPPSIAGACHPGRRVHRHGAGVFQAAAARRADVRRHAGVRHPARRRLHSLDPALVGGLSRR